MRTLAASSTSGVARFFGPRRMFLTLLLLTASVITLAVLAVAHGYDSHSAAADAATVAVSFSDGVSDATASSEVAVPGTRVFLAGPLSAPTLILMLLAVAVFAYRKKLSRQSLNAQA